MQFSVLSFGGLSSGLQTHESWLQWARGTHVVSHSEAIPALTHIPAMLRRRLSDIGRMALHAAHMADPEGRADKRVYGSRHGDIHRTLGLLESLVTTQTVSPAEFSVSVHNAIGALQGIAHKDCCDYTAVSAGENTAFSALVEACGLLDAGAKSVLVVLYDAVLPDAYQAYTTDPDFSYGFAILLAQADKDRGYYSLASHAMDRRQPVCDNLAIIRFLLLKDTLCRATDWSLSYHAA